MQPQKRVQQITRVSGNKPSPLVIIGGGVVLTGGVLLLSNVVMTMLSIAINAVSIAGIGIILVAIWYLFPAIVRSLMIGRKKIDDAMTKANPIEALKLNAAEKYKAIQEMGASLAQAGGALEQMKSTFAKQSASMLPDKQKEWMQTIAKRESQLAEGRKRYRAAKGAYDEYISLINNAEAELEMAKANNHMAKTLGSIEDFDIADSTKLALDEVSRRVGESVETMRLAMDEFDTDGKAI